MLHIVFLILKIILFLILAVLGLLLAIALAVLLVPIRYRAEASLHGEIHARGRISWLFRLISLSFSYQNRPEGDEEGLKTEVRLLGFRLFKRKEEKGKDEEKETEEKESGETEAAENETPEKETPEKVRGAMDAGEPVTALEDRIDPGEPGGREEGLPGESPIFEAPSEIPVKKASRERGSVPPKPPEKKPENHPEDSWREGGSPGGPGSRLLAWAGRIVSRLRQKKNRMAKALRKFRRRLYELARKKERLTALLQDEENRRTAGLILRSAKRLLRRLLPRLRGELSFGVEDPYLMGKILTVLAVFYPLYGKTFVLTPVFDENRLEGEFSLKGGLRLGSFAAFGLRILLDKNFRHLLRQFLREGGI